MAVDETLKALELLLKKQERTLSLTRWVLMTVCAGVLFIARTEWTAADHERRISSTEVSEKKTSEKVSVIWGRLNLVSRSDETDNNKPQAQ
jgi:hypothetical protein